MGDYESCQCYYSEENHLPSDGICIGQVPVKHKYKKLRGNKIRWCHILSGSESDLEALDKKWDGVKVQTSWKVECCYIDANFLDKGK